MQIEESFLLLVIPRLLVYCRIEMVVPSLTALLASPQGNGVGLL
jgi:hypothetical protein